MYHLFLLLMLAQATPTLAESTNTWNTKDECTSAFAEHLDELTAKFEEKGIKIVGASCATEDEMNKSLQEHKGEKDAAK